MERNEPVVRVAPSRPNAHLTRGAASPGLSSPFLDLPLLPITSGVSRGSIIILFPYYPHELVFPPLYGGFAFVYLKEV